MDLVIEGNAFINGTLKNTSIGIDDGRIVTIGNIVRGGDTKIELKDKLILPGFIDPHVHFRDPGLTRKEDFRSGTLSALFAGVTTVFDMPNTEPPVTDVRRLNEKKSAIRSKAYVDYGLFSALTPKCDVASLAPGSIGFKLFMGSTTGDILMNDDAQISGVMKKAAASGKVISVHAEDNNRIRKEQERSNRDHLKNRPIEAELNAISRLAQYRGAKINICHTTSQASVAMAESSGFTTEVTAHHLLFNSTAEGAEYKVNPPLRDENTREMLFKTFKDGKISMFGSDHAPHTDSEKNDDYGTAPSGIAGVEVTMPIMMALFKKNLVPLGMIVKMASYVPGHTFGLKKGKIEEGYDADFAIFDIKNIRNIDQDKLHSKSPPSIYDGMEALFPETVIIRGEIQVDNGELCGEMIGEDICGRH